MHNMRYLLTILFLFQISFCFPQQTESFDDFLKLFPGKAIDSTFQVNLLDRKYYPKHESLKAVRIERKTENYIAVIIQTDCFAGGLCESRKLYTFSNSGQSIDEFEIQEHKADCGFSDKKITEFFGVLFYTTTIKKESSCVNDSTISTKIQTKISAIQEDGTIQYINSYEIPEDRKYANISFQKLNKADLKDYSTEELAQMRNEIFATYGYIFKTPSWNQYFKNFDWYDPKKDQVSRDELNLIEQSNLDLILAEEKARK